MAFQIYQHSLFSDFDIQLFNAGKHLQLYEKFGSHLIDYKGKKGVYFAVYAPSALKVEVIGNFNKWDGHKHELFVRWDHSGIWEAFIEDVEIDELYKYRIYSSVDSQIREKADPFARLYEVPPKSASKVWADNYSWKDEIWLKNRKEKNNLNAPISVYELHIGSWKKQNNKRSLHYNELAIELVDYIVKMNFTHVEFLPIMEHPYYPSWGYLCTGYFAPTSRFGNPDEFKFLVDKLHQANIGVILDWVPAHFPSDAHALADFDGSKLYEHPQKSKGFHPDWNSLIFNYERAQIRSFLLSSAHFWCHHFHVDGLRVDAVASMLYLDYSRKEGDWQPNEFGGNEYLAAVDFLKDLNKEMYKNFPSIQIIAEESTAFPGVTKPVHFNGLGFGLKWMMGWMNDTLEYFSKDPIHRKFHHKEISRSLTYAFTENFILPLSHDEVVHGKQNLISKMPGDDWQKFANLRLLYTYMFTHPGQKLLFMGCEFAQTEEWNVNESLSWHLLDFDPHQGIQNLIMDLNKLFQQQPALYQKNYFQDGFEWIDYSDTENTVLAYIRKSEKEKVIVILNFSPVVRDNYLIGVDEDKVYHKIFNSDEKRFWGSDVTFDTLKSDAIPFHNKTFSINLSLPPLAGIILK